MKYRPIPMSERTRKLRELYLQLPVPQEVNPYVDKKYRRFCTGDRWMTLGYLRGWKNHADAVTTRLRTSYAEAQELYEAQPVFVGEELLAGHLYLPNYSEEEQNEYEQLCDWFVMSSHTLKERSPRKDHLGLGFEKLLALGINGIKQQIAEKLQELNRNDAAVYPDYESLKQEEFYQCCQIELDALLDLAKRYSEKAAELATATEGKRKEELLRISQILAKVPANPPETFYEAIQSVEFFLSNLFGLYPLGRPDRYLYPYYQRDVANGTLTAEEAQELIDCFCLKISTRVFSRAACGFIVGGQNADGSLVENELTWHFLTALDHLQLPDPNGALAVCGKTSDEILEYCTEILSRGTTHPAFYNDEAIVSGLVEHYGAPREDAVNYIHCTCAEMGIAGKTRSHTTPFTVGLPNLFVRVAKEHPDCDRFETFLQYYLAVVEQELQKWSHSYAIRMMEASRIGNEPMRVCVLIDDCIARGKSIYEGGERYTFVQPILIGFANAVDSLYALKRLVWEEKSLSLSEFLQIVEENFAGQEVLHRRLLQEFPHYGNDNESVDALAKQLADGLKEVFHRKNMTLGNQMMPGTFSYIMHASCGGNAGASFDGRVAHYSYSDGCCPVQGRDRSGPTAMIRSLTSWDQSEFLGGMVVNVKFSPEQMRGEKQKILPALVRAFVERGGIEMQVNVVSRETLLDAREHPEQHSDLLVRIGGFSDYFVRLTPTLQQEVIDRTEY